MPGADGPGSPVLHRVNQQSLKQLARMVLGGLGGLVLLVSGLFGGLAEAPAAGPPTAALEERIEGAPWAVTVADVVLTPELPPARLSQDGTHFLVVVAVVEVTAPDSRTDLGDIFRVQGVPGIEPEARPDAILMIRDATLAASLHPGLPERLGFLWERPDEAAAADEATVVVHGKTYRESALTGQMEWLDLEPKVWVTAPVRDRRDEDW